MRQALGSSASQRQSYFFSLFFLHKISPPSFIKEPVPHLMREGPGWIFCFLNNSLFAQSS
jgi:hypothetical protein